MDILGPLISFDDKTDFFALGLDSLQALRLRGVILKNLPIKSSSVGMNVVFDFPTVDALTKELLLLQKGAASVAVPVEEQMKALIEQYGVFPPHAPHENANGGHYVVSSQFHASEVNDVESLWNDR